MALQIEKEIQRRGWALSDEWGFDPLKHLEYISTVFDNKPDIKDTFTTYAWNYDVEDKRLLLQNNCPPRSWGDAHYDRLMALRDSGFIPETMIQIGTGKDASLTANLYRAFPEARRLTVVELSKPKIDGARETLLREGYDITKIDFRDGDLINVLPGLGFQVDLVENQNLLMHIPEKGENNRNIPPTWDESRMGHYPSLDRVLQAITKAIRPGGFAMVGDLAVRDWDTSVDQDSLDPDFEQNEEILSKVKHAKAYIATAIKLGWDVRGANAWRGAEEMANKISDFSEGKLVLEPELSRDMVIKNVSVDHPFTAITAYIPPTLALAISQTRMNLERAINESPNGIKEKLLGNLSRLQGAESFLWNEGAFYARLLQDTRVRTTLPTLHTQFFRKIA